MGGVYPTEQIQFYTNISINLSPVFMTNKLVTTSLTADQVIVSITPNTSMYLQGFSIYVWDTIMTSSMVVFGEASLESPPGKKLHTLQLTSMGLGRAQIDFSQPLAFPAHLEIRLVCSPSAPVHNQTWQGNFIGAA